LASILLGVSRADWLGRWLAWLAGWLASCTYIYAMQCDASHHQPSRVALRPLDFIGSILLPRNSDFSSVMYVTKITSFYWSRGGKEETMFALLALSSFSSFPRLFLFFFSGGLVHQEALVFLVFVFGSGLGTPLHQQIFPYLHVATDPF